MAEEYKGFRIFNTMFQHLWTNSQGVQIQYEDDTYGEPEAAVDATKIPTGELYINNEFAGFYPNSKYGVKAMLERACACLVKNDGANGNGCGWELDQDLYTRLNALDGTDNAYHPYKEKNPLLWTSNGQQTYTDSDGKLHKASKSVALVPCSYVYAMFFKNIVTGYKLMVALNYVGMHSYYSSYTSSGGFNDAGWLYNHVHSGMGLILSGHESEYCRIGGFMMSMIPPANPGGVQDDWHPEFSIRSDNFYPPTMFPIVCQYASNAYYNAYYGNGSTSYPNYPYAAYGSASLVRTGTTESPNGSSVNYSDKGCVVGTNSKISILLDTKGNIGISSYHKYTYTSNPILFLGPFFKKKLYDYDEHPQRYLCSFGYDCARNTDYRTDSPSSSQYLYSGWSVCAWNSTSIGNSYMLETNISTGDPASDQIYAAYPAVDDTVHTNYRYSKACYTPIGLIDEDVIRCSRTNGLIRGQTFNNGEWCYIYGVGVQTGTTASSYLYMSIRWDKDRNGTKTFIGY